MQTIDNIKKGLVCLGRPSSGHLPCSTCDWHGRWLPPCRIAICADAIALIEQLESQVIDGKPEPIHRPEDCVNYATRTRDGRAVCLGTRELDLCDGVGCKRWKGKVKDE